MRISNSLKFGSECKGKLEKYELAAKNAKCAKIIGILKGGFHPALFAVAVG